MCLFFIYRIWGVLILEGGHVGFFSLSYLRGNFLKLNYLSSLFFSSSRFFQVDQNFCFHNANIYSIAEITTTASTNCQSSVWLACTGRDLPEEGSTGHWELCMIPTRVLCRLQSHKLSLVPSLEKGEFLLLKQQFIRWVLPLK